MGNRNLCNGLQAFTLPDPRDHHRAELAQRATESCLNGTVPGDARLTALGRLMSRIQHLSDEVIDRIAAGEVVERPSSVVKELPENSLDAGAHRVFVQLVNGGKNRIVVDDDGRGMNPADAKRAVERHATSKLTQVEDLDQIATFGFRGEALSSIAAVSIFRLTTAEREAPGWTLSIRGGSIEDEAECAPSPGTRIEVDRLFFNVPARRKFLRADATELAHVVKLITRAALARPDVHFKLEHGAQTLLDVPVVETPLERLEQLLGRDRARRMLPFELESDGLRVHGFAGRPVEGQPRRDSQHLYVNGRVVQDRVLLHSVRAAYGETMPKGRHPAMVLFVEIDPAEVDVNVHPQKTEVRFQNSRQVHETVRQGIRSALGHDAAVPTYSELRPGDELSAGSSPDRGNLEHSTANDSSWIPVSGPLERPQPLSPDNTSATSNPYETAEPPKPTRSWLDEQGGSEASVAMALGQFRESYIVAQDQQGLLLVDQHAAHERVLFERYLEDANNDVVERQSLMFPITLDFSADEFALLQSEIDEFRRIGFSMEPFGGFSIRLTEIPAVAGGVEPEELIRELLGDAADAKSATQDNMAIRRKLITTAACHAAIKVHYPLKRPTMQRLLDDLFRVENPTTCPHGRPALFRLTQDDIERAFRRR
jgi:DNA mismatch repair protein MutL